MRETLRKYEIIRKRKEIERLLLQGNRIQSANVTIQFLPAIQRRVAFLVSKEIKTAVKRNLMRRRLKEIYRRNKAVFPVGLEYIIKAEKNAITQDFKQLKEELLSLAKTIKDNA